MIVAENPIISNLEVLFQSGDTVELRCVGNQTINGYYRDLNKLAQDSETLNTDFSPQENVYVCLNPVLPDLYARRADQFGRTERGGSVKDNQVVCRRWLLVDLDPVRPSGVSATKEQKQAAEAVAQRVYAWLADQLGSHCLVCADSGNGSHILVRLDDLPVDDQSRWVCERFLSMLSDRFSSELAKVDETTFNAARITACYGTMKRKGSDLPEQPHRRSKLVLVPDSIQPADWDTLTGLVDPYPGKQQQTPLANGQAMMDIPALLLQHEVRYTQDDQYQTNSGEIATLFELDVCPFNAEHTDRSAVIAQWPSNGATAFRCHHDGCIGKDWPALRDLWDVAAPGINAEDIVFSVPTSNPIATAPTLDSHIDAPAIDPVAFYGPLGEIVQRLDSEASPIAVLCSALAYFSTGIGRKVYLMQGQIHYPKLYCCLVGVTGAGRKGTADVEARRIINAVDPLWETLQHGGLSTGEGMLEVLRLNMDGIHPSPAIFTEREFAAVLKRAERQGNTLLVYVRNAWDNETLANNSKSDPVRIDDHHVSILGHVTAAELKRLLTGDDVSNGFANRFLWIHSQRPGLRPGAIGFRAIDFQSQIAQLQSAAQAVQDRFTSAGQQPLRMNFDVQAEKLWNEQLYQQLDIDSDQDTLLTLMCGRQAQQVCRLAMCFALTTAEQTIEVKHLQAACAITSYVWDTVDYMLSRDWWGDKGNAHDPAGMAPKALQLLRERGSMTRTAISAEALQKNRTAKEINALRDHLVLMNQIHVEKKGRTETWQIVS